MFVLTWLGSAVVSARSYKRTELDGGLYTAQDSYST